MNTLTAAPQVNTMPLVLVGESVPFVKTPNGLKLAFGVMALSFDKADIWMNVQCTKDAQSKNAYTFTSECGGWTRTIDITSGQALNGAHQEYLQWEIDSMTGCLHSVNELLKDTDDDYRMGRVLSRAIFNMAGSDRGGKVLSGAARL